MKTKNAIKKTQSNSVSLIEVITITSYFFVRYGRIASTIAATAEPRSLIGGHASC